LCLTMKLLCGSKAMSLPKEWDAISYNYKVSILRPYSQIKKIFPWANTLSYFAPPQGTKKKVYKMDFWCSCQTLFFFTNVAES
jgi:hypothetical protein